METEKAEPSPADEGDGVATRQPSEVRFENDADGRGWRNTADGTTGSIRSPLSAPPAIQR